MKKMKFVKKTIMIIFVMLIILEGAIGTKEAKASVTLDFLMKQYVGTTWNGNYRGAIQCKGFAAMIWNRLYGVQYIGNYDSQKYYIPKVSGGYEIGRLNFSQMNQSAAASLLKKGQAGDFIQVRRRGRKNGHSMIYVSQDSRGVVVFDCNSDGRNGVRKYHISWKNFYSKNSAMSMYRANNAANTHTNNTPSIPAVKYSIDNVRVSYIDSDKITITWSTTNLPRVCMVVIAGDRTFRTSYANSSCGGPFYATFNRSMVSGCPSTVQLLIYGYSNTSGAGQNETLHRVTYNAPAGYVSFPAKQKKENKSWSESVPHEMLSRGCFAGWVISDESPISSVRVNLNGKTLYAPLADRADVSRAYPAYKYAKGYNLNISPYYIKDGNNSYSVIATLANGTSITVAAGNFKGYKVDELFDPVFFKARYSDVYDVKKLNTDEQLEKYFYDNMNTMIDGEYLMPCMVYSPSYYVRINSDLYAQNWKTAYEIYDHFLKYCIKTGKGEYRATSPWVSLYYLHNTYGDLWQMSAEELLKWSASWGLKIDQRQLSSTIQAKAFRKLYQISDYAALNKDLIRAYSKPVMISDFGKTHANEYWTHFWYYGISENRLTSKSFNVAAYRRNAGLSSKASAWTVFNHYCSIGYGKGISTK